MKKKKKNSKRASIIIAIQITMSICSASSLNKWFLNQYIQMMLFFLLEEFVLTMVTKWCDSLTFSIHSALAFVDLCPNPIHSNSTTTRVGQVFFFKKKMART